MTLIEAKAAEASRVPPLERAPGEEEVIARIQHFFAFLNGATNDEHAPKTHFVVNPADDISVTRHESFAKALDLPQLIIPEDPNFQLSPEEIVVESFAGRAIVREYMLLDRIWSRIPSPAGALRIDYKGLVQPTPAAEA